MLQIYASFEEVSWGKDSVLQTVQNLSDFYSWGGERESPTGPTPITPYSQMSHLSREFLISEMHSCTELHGYNSFCSSAAL